MTSNAIFHFASYSYTPKQREVDERKISFLFHDYFPFWLWGYCFDKLLSYNDMSYSVIDDNVPCFVIFASTNLR